MTRVDSFCVSAVEKNSHGQAVTIHCGVVAIDIEDAIAAFKLAHPDSTLWTVSHRGMIEIITSDAAIAKEAEGEARLAYIPSPERWADVQSRLAATKERLAAAETRCDELTETNANNIANYQMQLEDIDKERGDKYLSAECRTHGCQVHRLMAEVERMKRAPWVENRDLTQRLAVAEALLREAMATAGQWEYLPRYGIVMTHEWMERAKEVCDGTTTNAPS